MTHDELSASIAVIQGRLKANDKNLLEMKADVASVLTEIKHLREDFRDSEQRRIRECDMRHAPMSRRIGKLETEKDGPPPKSRKQQSDDSAFAAYAKLKTAMWSAIGAVAVSTGLAIFEFFKAIGGP